MQLTQRGSTTICEPHVAPGQILRPTIFLNIDLILCVCYSRSF